MAFADAVHESIQTIIQQGQHEIACWMLTKFLDEYPGHGEAHHSRAMLAHAQGDEASAAEHLYKAAALMPDSPEAQKSLGDFLHVVNNDAEAALAQYMKVVALDPKDTETCMAIAHLNVALYRFDEAQKYYRKVLALDLGNIEARRCLEKLTSGQNSNSSAAMLQQARQCSENGDKAQALEVLKRIVAQDPGNAVAHNDLGVIHFDTGRKDLAQQYYEKAAALDPHNAVFQKNLGDFYYVEQGKIEKALRHYVQALTIDPMDVETLLSTGHICMGFKRPEDATVFFRRVLEIEPANETASQLLAKIDGAGSEKSAPDTEEALYTRAQDLATDGDVTGAIRCLGQVLANNPTHALSYNDLGVLHYGLGAKDKALRFYQQAVRIDDSNPTFQKNLADFYYIEQGRAEDALSIYVRVLEANREDVDCLLAAGTICADMNKDEDARVFFERILSIEPWHQQAGGALKRLDSKNQTRGCKAAAVR